MHARRLLLLLSLWRHAQAERGQGPDSHLGVTEARADDNDGALLKDVKKALQKTGKVMIVPEGSARTDQGGLNLANGVDFENQDVVSEHQAELEVSGVDIDEVLKNDHQRNSAPKEDAKAKTVVDDDSNDDKPKAKAVVDDDDDDDDSDEDEPTPRQHNPRKKAQAQSLTQEEERHHHGQEDGQEQAQEEMTASENLREEEAKPEEDLREEQDHAESGDTLNRLPKVHYEKLHSLLAENGAVETSLKASSEEGEKVKKKAEEWRLSEKALTESAEKLSKESERAQEDLDSGVRTLQKDRSKIATQIAEDLREESSAPAADSADAKADDANADAKKK
mmetsp:Transcript_93362/g.166034  ORF Transcript_93362/g.166034 Transcript_93362/m.166034 type:complete len:336 (+) Transcript_93362:69-1076(+)